MTGAVNNEGATRVKTYGPQPCGTTIQVNVKQKDGDGRGIDLGHERKKVHKSDMKKQNKTKTWEEFGLPLNKGPERRMWWWGGA